ncbi:MAG: winged helix-turn-helix domain-containing protein [Candidatus Woesearchaeota archaeon]
MGRGSTQILIRKIMESLAKGPKSTSEISQETGLDRTAIIRYLDVLKESKFLSEEQKGTKKIFHISSTYRLDTYFGLPLTKEINEKIDSIYNKIRSKWKEKTGRKLLKTIAQKIICDVIKKCELNIPVGWYIYGGVCVKPYDYNNPYEFKGLNNEIMKCVNETVIEYSENSFAYESKQQQYRKANNKLYDLKEDILRLLYSKNFSKNSMYVLQKKYLQFARLIPKGDEIYSELINDYDTLIIDIIKNWDDFVDEKDSRNFAEFKHELTCSFEALWKLVAMFNFKQDLFNGGFYLQTVLDEHFKLDIAQAKEELIEISSELNDMIPFEEPTNYKQVKEALSKMKPISKEERQKQINELEKIRKEKGLKAFNEELFKRAGLK